MQQLNIDAVFGIARTLLEKAEAARREVGYVPDEDRRTADVVARDAIVWSNETYRAMEKDSARFAALSGKPSGDAWADANDEINSIGDWRSFEMGFDLAVRLTARIMLDPLESHDISDLLDKAQATYLEWLEDGRDEYFKHRWQQRVERELAKDARLVGVT
jgi:hypothetical protein